MATLETYRAKRDFTKTSEPAGKAKASRKKAEGGIFVIHKHDARRLHYDLRLEHDGVLWSWAVTRGPSLDPDEKRLAVHVEDHPIEYGAFEGNIPKGQYGGGSVIVWDEGRWQPEYDPDFGMKKGHLSFNLDGHKLHGGWHLVRLKPRRGEKRDNWLLMKADDEAARPEGDILEDEPDSVASGRSVQDVAKGKPAPKVSKTARGRKAKASLDVEIPEFVEPCLATLVEAPPAGDDWLHEVKFDGYRMQARVDRGVVTLLTRTGLNWTTKFGTHIRDALRDLDCDSAIIDSEIVVLREHGVSSFSALQQALSEERTDEFVCFAFDLLFLDGEDLRGEPLVERKARLEELLGEIKPDAVLRYSEHFVEPGDTMLKHACRMGLEGVVSKRVDAKYHSGRGKIWLKSKCVQRQEFIILGYAPSKVAGRGIRSLLVGYHEGKALKYVGRVGTGFTASSANMLRKVLDPLKVSKPAITGPGARQPGVVWVKPERVAEVEFGSWTDEGVLRHAAFQGLREDKDADEIEAEKPASTQIEPPKRKGPARSGPVSTAGIKLSHADKLLWPDAKVSKQALLDYYAAVWPRMERFVVGRPLSLLRAPDGIEGQKFFQKHASPGMPAAILRTKDPHDGEELLSIKDFEGLAALVQLGVVEIHIWGSTLRELEKPDQIVFDLDPDPEVGVDAVRQAALDLRGRLDELGFESFVKLSGGKGYHVMMPLKPAAEWAAVKSFAHDFAKAMAEAEPKRFTATLSKKARHGRIFIDYLRNGRGSTAVAPYSIRARPRATVAWPVSWSALEKGIGPADVTTDVDAELKRSDAWADFWKGAKALKRG